MQNQFLTEDPAPAYVPFAAPREKSLQTGAAVTQAQTLQVETLLMAAKRKVRRRNTKYWIYSTFAQAFNISMQVLVHQFPASIRHGSSGELLLVLFAISEVFVAIALICLMHRPVDFDIEELAQLGGVRAVPSLVGVLRSTGAKRAARPIHRVLMTLLPQMKASDADLLTGAHRRHLNMLLKLGIWPNIGNRPEPGFVVAVLKAYEQVGDAKAIPIVKRLANCRGNSERKRKIREAARQCLPLLQSHLGDLNTTQTLLRASSPSMAAPDVLLRPVGEASPAPAGELLRAADTSSVE